MVMLNRRGLVLLLPLWVGCGSGETSIKLIFPNEVAKTATRRLQVNAYNPETNASAAIDRTCADFSGKARTGTPPVGNPERGDFDCRDPSCPSNWFADKVVPEVSSGRKVIYVLGYAEVQEGATPILEGCSDQFDTDGGGDERNEVPVELKLVIPDSARLVKSGGDRQVGRAGQPVGIPLQVRVEADAPGGAGGPYVIPGVPIAFTSVNDDFRITTGSDPVRFETFSNQQGTAEIGLLLPNQPGQGDVEAEAPALEVTNNEERSKVTFSVSVTDPVDFPVQEVINSAGGNRPIGAAIGQLIPGGAQELAVLSCTGTEAGCKAGHVATTPFGATHLAVFSDLGNSKTSVTIEAPVNGLGILPVGLAIANLVPGGGDELAVVNSRTNRNNCQSRVCLPNQPCGCYRADRAVQTDCPCEGSEALVMASVGAGGPIRTVDRLTLTGSNAIGLAAVKQGAASGAGLYNLVVAHQGRAKHERPCAKSPRCLPYLTREDCEADPSKMMSDCACLGDPALNCGCPPGERCECIGPNCNEPNTPGVCVARDNLIDIVARTPTQQLYNRYGCQEPTLWCPAPGQPAGSSGTCQDRFRENTVSGRDGCSCTIPDQIQMGDGDSSVNAAGIAAGAIRNTDDFDLVVPSVGGLELIESKANNKSYAWSGSPIVNSRIQQAIIAQMDPLTDGETAESPADVVWFSREACVDGNNFLSLCPIWRDIPRPEQKGCLGVYFTAGARSVFELPKAGVGGCRRHYLDYKPDGMCVGDFNSDGNRDVLVSAVDVPDLLVYSGDGRGGLLDPPERLALPSGGGGPMACGDVDGDGRDDAVVLNLANGAIQILRSGS
jgi:hypothetical protein